MHSFRRHHSELFEPVLLRFSAAGAGIVHRAWSEPTTFANASPRWGGLGLDQSRDLRPVGGLLLCYLCNFPFCAIVALENARVVHTVAVCCCLLRAHNYTGWGLRCCSIVYCPQMWWMFLFSAWTLKHGCVAGVLFDVWNRKRHGKWKLLLT